MLIIYIQHCVTKLEKLYDGWRKLQKKTATLNINEDLESTFDDLFDVTHQDTLTMIAEKDRQFFVTPKKKGRPDCIGGVDMKYVRAE